MGETAADASRMIEFEETGVSRTRSQPLLSARAVRPSGPGRRRGACQDPGPARFRGLPGSGACQDPVPARIRCLPGSGACQPGSGACQDP
eukprot:gene21180-biopygen2639